jgi:predicted flap endonuclease-1-like 5' DNA nuclease
MRSDITLYIVAAFFFIITAISAILIVEAERSLWIITTAVLGILSVGLGYSQRSRAIVPAQTVKQATISAEPIAIAPQTAPVEEKAPEIQAAPTIEATPVIETPIQPLDTETQPVIEAPPAPIIPQEPAPAIQTETAPNETAQESPLTKIKGIGEKRATQLNALGISTIEELAKASAEDVAKSLKISPKIVAKWVDGAKQQQK